MAQRYYSNYGGYTPRSKQQRNPVMTLLDGVLTIVSVVVAVLLLVALIVPAIRPEYTWALPMLGLIAPVLYLTVVGLALYWVMRWRLLRAVAMSLLVVVGLFSISLYWRPEARREALQRKYDTKFSYPRSAISLLSYNVRYLYSDSGNSSADSLAAWLDTLRADVICLQEVNGALATRSARLSAVLESYNEAKFGLEEGVARELRILTRHKIINSGVVLKPSSSVWADMVVREDTIRVINNHLQSTGITVFDSDYLTGHAYLMDTAREVKLRSIASRFSDNCVLRAAQVDTIRAHIDTLGPSLKVVCGDFNDTPLSYTYRRMARGLRDAFSEHGEGYSYTFRGFFNALRIDYVLSSKEIEVLSYETPEVNLSDHRPVLVRLQKRKL